MQTLESARPLGLDRGDGGLLLLVVERRDDTQAPAIDLSRGELESVHLLLNRVEQKSLAAAVAVCVGLLVKLGQLVAVFGELRAVDRAGFRHSVEHVVVALNNASGAAFGIRVVIRGAVDDRGQHGRLRDAEF